MLVGVVQKSSLDEYEALFAQAQQAQLQSFDALELRLDYCRDLNLDEFAAAEHPRRSAWLDRLGRIIELSPLPIILTLRPPEQGGAFQGNETLRRTLLEELARLRPSVLDLETTLPPEFLARLVSLLPDNVFILSHHDFAKAPASLEALEDLLGEMRNRLNIPNAIYKIAARCDCTADALRMLIFCREQRAKGVPVVGISMGEAGQSTRILATWAHGEFCYCPAHPPAQPPVHLQDHSPAQPPANSPDETPNAPAQNLSQITAEELCEVYNYRRITKATALYGLIGDPVSRSLGHLYHNSANLAANCNAVYLKWKLAPHELAEAMPLFQRLGVQGLSVTMPLKEAIMPYLSTMLDDVRAIGAANTLRLQPDGWRGANTDGPGAVEALPFALKGKNLTLLGAGGAARAIMHEAHRHGARLTLYNRSLNRSLPQSLPPGLVLRPLERLRDLKNQPCDLIINTLPPELNLPYHEINFRPGCLAMDISYNKTSTFLEQARQAGCQILDGTNMFYMQANIQRAFWGLPG